MNRILIFLTVAVVLSLAVSAAPAEKVLSVVCPILKGNAGNVNSQAFSISMGHGAKCAGPYVMIPAHVINWGGFGSQKAYHASPGKGSAVYYSPHWNYFFP